MMTVRTIDDDRIALGNLGVLVISACAAIAPMINAVYNETFDILRLLLALLILNALYIVFRPRIVINRECLFYAMFVAYMALSTIWTPDALLSLNTLIPSLNFLLIMILYSSLISHNDVGLVLRGLLIGFVVGAIAYTLREGFPFAYPRNFSYNAAAGMYLFGLFITLLYGWYSGRRLIAISLGFVILLHIAATTSIKTNLGILLAVFVAGLIFFGRSIRLLQRNSAYVLVVIALAIYGASTSGAVVERVQAGFDRVSLGVAALQARQDITGSTSIDLRQDWTLRGLEGWLENPLFGHGVESFRANIGITSHATPIDLLYNTGLIGFALFYAMFVSIAWRLIVTSQSDTGNLRPLQLAALVCYVFMTLSGTFLYQSFLAVFVALSSVTLARYQRQETY